ncbi:SRPBCC family protein [Pseudonocardia xinjiangensis]|uniref:SRPBCC domain-containing protein n=1 Tax=Pseudonocardia xinjiangensis TaxID=75289 RepID=A0ABX1RH52_9PSEU|nr:SRPBCC domain-containing protein [Pseudonocardia xinjiangensis]NMH78799.1 SRPBCC domain-containing protein [Pseudonocardia xinjiangensis]
MTLVPHTVTVTRIVAASPAAIYAAWTEPDQMRRWYATVVDADVRVGGRYRIELHEADGSVNRFTGEYLALEPHSRIAFTFTHHSQTPEDRISDETVTVTLREVEPGRTEVTVTNSWTGPEFEPSYYEDLRSGWEEWVNRLEKMC